MNRKLFVATFLVAFIIGLVVGACHNYPTATTASEALERVEDKDSISFSQASETYIVVIGGIPRNLNAGQMTQIAQAFCNISYSYYQFKDYEEYDWDNFKKIRPYTFWDDCISETFDYDVIDEILNGDWGNFYDSIDE